MLIVFSLLALIAMYTLVLKMDKVQDEIDLNYTGRRSWATVDRLTVVKYPDVFSAEERYVQDLTTIQVHKTNGWTYQRLRRLHLQSYSTRARLDEALSSADPGGASVDFLLAKRSFSSSALIARNAARSIPFLSDTSSSS